MPRKVRERAFRSNLTDKIVGLVQVRPGIPVAELIAGWPDDTSERELRSAIHAATRKGGALLAFITQRRRRLADAAAYGQILPYLKALADDETQPIVRILYGETKPVSKSEAVRKAKVPSSSGHKQITSLIKRRPPPLVDEVECPDPDWKHDARRHKCIELAPDFRDWTSRMLTIERFGGHKLPDHPPFPGDHGYIPPA
jgi:hypothetical protein